MYLVYEEMRVSCATEAAFVHTTSSVVVQFSYIEKERRSS